MAETWSAPVRVGRDGTFVRLPAGSAAIGVEELLRGKRFELAREAARSVGQLTNPGNRAKRALDA